MCHSAKAATLSAAGGACWVEVKHQLGFAIFAPVLDDPESSGHPQVVQNEPRASGRGSRHRCFGSIGFWPSNVCILEIRSKGLVLKIGRNLSLSHF